MEIELKIGSEFFFGETKLIVAKEENCGECFFNNNGECRCRILECRERCRQDKTGVIFVEADEE